MGKKICDLNLSTPKTFDILKGPNLFQKKARREKHSSRML